MITDEQQERFAGGEIAAQTYRVAVTARLGLLDKFQPAGMRFGGGSIRWLITRTNDNTNLVYARGQDFLNNNSQGGFGKAIAIHQCLQRKCTFRSAARSIEVVFC